MVCRSLTGLWVIVRSQLPIGAPRMARPAVLRAQPCDDVHRIGGQHAR